MAFRYWTVAVALAAGLTVSGCTAGDGEGFPTFEQAVKGDQVDPDSFLSALRSSFRAGSTAAITFDVRGGAALRGTGSVRYTADTMDASLKIDDWRVEGASIDLRTVGGTTYMRVVESRGLWVNLSDSGTALPGADLAEDADPRRAIGDLRDTITQVRFSGDETLDGVRTRRFQVVTKPKPGSDSTPSPGSTAGAADSDHPTVTEYWFDDRGRVVRRHSELAQTWSATFTWARWGKPVKIARPAKGMVITLKRLEQLRKQQATSPR
jgi:hypothetical protein